ncbi:MAG: bacteriohemerythrin [Proteobacteria bacterium]|nr:bacteriohemerythrin [Pseudomonadota bacterium]MCL2308260.1 bacteriohemerythrin [Pseudomonadota bacterium]
MAHIKWTDELSVGIGAIDKQHRRIIEYVNKLHDNMNDRRAMAEVLADTIEYTESHFGFEETMLEAAGYPYLQEHKRTHDLFVRRIEEYKERFEAGEDIGKELHDALVHWLAKHIKSEDTDCSVSLIAKFGREEAAISRMEKNRLGKSWFTRLFAY